MAERENHALRLHRELRDDIKALDNKVDSKINALNEKIDRNHQEVERRLDSLQRAMIGESFLGRYATAEFEDRLTALERRASDLKREN